MRSLIRALLLTTAMVLACSTPANTSPRMAVTFHNGYLDPVDVRFYCGPGQVKVERWVMFGERRRFYVRAGVGCDLRVIIRPSVEGGPYTERDVFDSEMHLYQWGHCETLDLRTSGLLASAYMMPGGCRR